MPKNRPSFSSLLLFVAACLLIVTCTTIPGTHDSAFLLTTPAEEAKMGNEAFKQVLKTAKESTDTHMKAIVVRVGTRIAQVAEARHQVGFKWQFKLIESKELNAFCLPGGKIVVYTGILKTMANEASLAIVLGHEVAHATLRHAGRRLSQQMAIGGLLAASAVASGLAVKDPTTRDVAIAALGAGAAVGFILPFSRANESQADAYGLEYAAQAGYDPNEAINFWHRMQSAAGHAGKMATLLSDHPADATRISALQKEIPYVLPLYERSPQYGLGENLL